MNLVRDAGQQHDAEPANQANGARLARVVAPKIMRARRQIFLQPRRPDPHIVRVPVHPTVESVM